MATNKTVSSKKSARSKKSTSAKQLVFKKFSTLQLLVFSLIFVAAGATAVYFVRAATPSPWAQLASRDSCTLNVYGVPATIKEPSVGPCVYMLKYILHTYAGAKDLPIDSYFTPDTTVAVKNLKRLFGVYNVYGVIDGWVDPNTWSVVQTVYILGSKPPAPPAPCINPFVGGSWGLSRTDQGVDFNANGIEPVRAICNGILTSTAGPGWPGGVYMQYKLTSNPPGHPELLGKCIYVAERLNNFTPITSPGQSRVVKAGEIIANAYSSTEWGWSAAPGTPATRGPENYATTGGKAFARFLNLLGAPTEMDPGSGPLYAGNSC